MKLKSIETYLRILSAKIRYLSKIQYEKLMEESKPSKATDVKNRVEDSIIVEDIAVKINNISNRKYYLMLSYKQ